tara:strand:- start:3573 stop:4493 length:921 start_codon:yes stop_codon:yes gene_type:complete
MKKSIVKISEGLGNQLFMYANAYSISKKLGYNLFIDHLSGYKDNYLNEINPYLLNNFNISSNECNITDTSIGYFNYLKHKSSKSIDFLRNKKMFISEEKNKKTTFISFKDYTKNIVLSNKIYIDGFFQSEKHFIDYKKDILKEYEFKNISYDDLNIDINRLKDKNSVSIVVRTNRYNERSKKDLYDNIKTKKSDLFIKNTIDYIYKAAEIFKKKLDNPTFFVWSNDFSNLRNYFNDEFNFVINKKNKTINDLYTISLCSNFIIGPSTFHWWGAYLSKHPNKICICPPKLLNFSSNLDIYPSNWIKF